LDSRQSLLIPLAELVVGDKLDLYPDVEKHGYFSVQFSGRDLQLTAGGYIGLIPINDRLIIDVQPKLPVGNLMRVIQVAQETIVALDWAHRHYDSRSETTTSILEFLAHNLLHAFRAVELHGLHKVYVPRTENSSHPHGRLHFRETAIRNYSRGIRHRIYSTHFEQTTDEPYNRLLKRSLWMLSLRLQRVPQRDRDLVRQLNQALLWLETVTLDQSDALLEQVKTDLSRHRVPPHRQYYERVLGIALTVLAGRGVELIGRGQEVELSSYIISFEDLFESYIRQVLHARIPAQDPQLRVRNGNKEAEKQLFRGPDKRPANPDIVIDQPPTVKLIADVKYKSKVERADINQGATYALSYGTRRVVLIYQCAAGDRTRSRHLGAIGDVEVYTYGFDLANADLDAEEQALGGAVLTLAQAAP